ncbi:hypothetical protein B7486_67105, partial [cyanobacterium TDX16]
MKGRGRRRPGRRDRALEASEHRIAALLEHASDAVAVVDLQGVIRYMSAPIEGILGWTPEEMVGRASSDFVHP